MKRKLLTMILSISLILSLTSAFSFAETEQNSSASMILEKLDEVVMLLEEEQETEMTLLNDGTLYAKKEYVLEDDGLLTVELLDEGEEMIGTEMMNQGPLPLPLALAGSNSLWKAYGKRYFTAKATVSYKDSEVHFSLENHYTLSANGIDERYGVSNADTAKVDCSIIEGTVIIDDRMARTPGDSDVNMYCTYTIKATTGVTCKYKLGTTVKYLNHDKTNKKIKVGQSWSLKKV